MTDDRHIRIYNDGKEENLPALRSIRLVSKDLEEDKKLEVGYYKFNREIMEMMSNKGFTRFTINMYSTQGLHKKGIIK